ncbi:MAG: glycosyltransferase [Burkholderiales bacterium]|nr:glycosyltransferase [Burkholderiales bacterium]
MLDDHRSLLVPNPKKQVNPLKIVMLGQSLDTGGAERQLMETAIGLKQLGHDLTVMLFYERGEYLAKLEDEKILTVGLKKRGRWEVFRFLFRAFKAMRELNPDVIYCFLSVPNIVGAFLKLLFPNVILIWGIRNSARSADYKEFWTRVAFWLELKLKNSPDLLIANSHAAMHVLADGKADTPRLVFVPNGIDAASFKPDPAGRARLRLEWKLNQQISLIGIVARLDVRKDHVTFLRMAKLLVDTGRKVHFAIVGSGDSKYQAELVAFATLLGIGENITWVGARADMAAVYSALDLLVLSSTTEGFPNVLAEAMACGVQCVSTDVGEARLILNNEQFIAVPRDPNSLKCAVVRALDTPPDPAALRQNILDNFSKERLALRIEKIVLSLLSSGANRSGSHI